DTQIWSPSRDVGLCFLTIIRYLEDRLNISSGLREYMSDTVDVDFNVMEEFLTKLAALAHGPNTSMEILLKGAVLHMLAIAFWKGEIPKHIADLYPKNWIEDAKVLSQTRMPRES